MSRVRQARRPRIVKDEPTPTSEVTISAPPRMLTTGIPPDSAMARQLVDVVLRGLREPTSD